MFLQAKLQWLLGIAVDLTTEVNRECQRIKDKNDLSQQHLESTAVMYP